MARVHVDGAERCTEALTRRVLRALLAGALDCAVGRYRGARKNTSDADDCR